MTTSLLHTPRGFLFKQPIMITSSLPITFHVGWLLGLAHSVVMPDKRVMKLNLFISDIEELEPGWMDVKFQLIIVRPCPCALPYCIPPPLTAPTHSSFSFRSRSKKTSPSASVS